MCLFQTPTPKVEKYKESAQSRYPDDGTAINSAARRTTDRMRATTSTILTSGSGVTSSAPTEKKTLLGA